MFQSKSPLYYQLAEIIINDIKEKNLQENDRILTEREYCEKYNLSRSTVRQAIAYLEKKGYIYKVQGCGTFVSSRVMKQKLLKFYSFTEEAKKQGKTPSSKILSFKEKKADEKICKELNINRDDKVYELQRLRLADDEVVMYEKTYLLEKKMQGLSKNILLENPLYDILQNRYNISFTKATERFSVLLADEKIAEILTIPQGSPIIRLQRWTYAGMEIIEYTVSLVRGDRFEFEVELEEK
ncbi:MAG: GntR family transcriptional regulator [Fusobacterium sp.]|uniref:GntR family transcriptional regulator n=1 Tax=Fusobacterium sp. TaxID=68766 RepID=UPI0025EF6805|nr:GntR family transcriptional regulator [Fusobacterium sp.]MDY3060594.1 GntR family transcriptional regulator [Fusobacterium sp.]MEE1474938.1 GntR family transcriptional regulator [Fusobacterium sp.]